MAATERADSTATERGSDRPALIVVAIALASVVVLSWLVGRVGAPKGERFDWQLASVFGTALGTTLLAAATGWLAWSTRSEVRATQDLAELTARQQATSERPVVVLKVASFSGSPDSGYVQVSLYNAGLGPAFRVHVSATYVGHEDWQPSISNETVAVIAPSTGATPQLFTRFPEPQQPGGVRSDGFSISGSYLDRSMENEYPIITSWPED